MEYSPTNQIVPYSTDIDVEPTHIRINRGQLKKVTVPK